MNRFLCGLMALAALLGSSTALADWHERGHGRHWGRTWGGERPGWGWGHEREERYERQEPNSHGRYELRATNVWVPGGMQQVWVPGACYQTARGQHCNPGSYQTYVTQGHYETRQEYVWVPCG